MPLQVFRSATAIELEAAGLEGVRLLRVDRRPPRSPHSCEPAIVHEPAYVIFLVISQAYEPVSNEFADI